MPCMTNLNLPEYQETFSRYGYHSVEDLAILHGPGTAKGNRDHHGALEPTLASDREDQE